MQHFREANPAVELDLMCLSTEEQREHLLRGEPDLGLAWLPVEDAGIVTQPLAREDLFVAIPAGSRLKRRRAVLPADLAAWPIAFGRRTRSVASTLTDLLRTAGVAPQRLRQAGDLNAAIDMVAACEGLAIVPRSMSLPVAGLVAEHHVDRQPERPRILRADERGERVQGLGCRARRPAVRHPRTPCGTARTGPATAPRD